MTELSTYASEIMVPVVIGLAVSLYLRGVTSRLLVDICGTRERSEFWVKINTVLTLAFPMVLVLLFGRSLNPNYSLAEILRHSLALSLIGTIVGVSFMARKILKTIPVGKQSVAGAPSASNPA